MTIWKAGMLAVCVDLRKGRYGNPPLKLNAVYRVVRIGPHPDNGRTLLALAHVADGKGWDAVRFRPLTSADDAFTEQMRALKPAKSPERVA